MSRRPGQVLHLARRFLWSLRPPAPAAADVAWAHSWLTPAEAALWDRQALADRAHSLAVARWLMAQGPNDPPRWALAAALLHDVGKAEARLGVAGRTLATLAELAGIRRLPGRLGRYLDYGRVGAAQLQALGSDERVVAWAAEHHLGPPERSGVVPETLADRLVRADNNA